jgi:hypothetical protein
MHPYQSFPPPMPLRLTSATVRSPERCNEYPIILVQEIRKDKIGQSINQSNPSLRPTNCREVESSRRS